MKILLAEDDEASRRIIQTILTSKGHTVITVKDGVELLEEIEKNNIDIIITDIRMPNLNGISAAIITKYHMNKEIPIIAITGIDPSQMVSEPFTGVLYKPIALDKLLELIK